jgi:hypothetical protein
MDLLDIESNVRVAYCRMAAPTYATTECVMQNISSRKRCCEQCGARFGLIRHRWYRHQFCSVKCRASFVGKLAERMERMRESLRFFGRPEYSRKIAKR